MCGDADRRITFGARVGATTQKFEVMSRATCRVAAAHSTCTDGSWRVRSSPPPYRINASLWEELGSSIRRSTPQHYGRCDEAMPTRSLYEWRPSRCSLAPFAVEGACAALRGQSVLFVGDSTVFQLFLSFALLLNAKLGRSSKKASTISEMTGSACDDEVRLAFSRSDLLLWSASNSDLNSVKRCDGFTNLQVWQQRAAHADLLVLGLGHHFPGSLGGAEQHSRCDHEVLPPGSPTRTGLNVHCRIAMHAFFPQNLNHTLNSIIQARQANARGLRPPELSIALVGTTTPVSGCSRFNEPISLSTYASKSYEHRRTVDSPMW